MRHLSFRESESESERESARERARERELERHYTLLSSAASRVLQPIGLWQRHYTQLIGGPSLLSECSRGCVCMTRVLPLQIGPLQGVAFRVEFFFFLDVMIKNASKQALLEEIPRRSTQSVFRIQEVFEMLKGK